MPKSVTIRLDDDAYKKFHERVAEENRSISSLIETLALKKLDEELFTGTFETAEILSNKPLLRRLKKGHQHAAQKKGRLLG
ncbi:MAG: ribbon-helix-helix protein, CopG family [Candidatus Aenigmarchaeota archaeon]|nr:ribbon-helix-helix protein, CopG family [Candidatus Aenigmarchaeota archaeon]